MVTSRSLAWLSWSLLSPCVTLAAASVGIGSASAPAPTDDDARALHRAQQARCKALQVAAVQTECLRQADRELARRLGLAPPADRR